MCDGLNTLSLPFAMQAYMSGNSIQIFSIIMTFSLLAQPITAIISSGQSGCGFSSFGIDYCDECGAAKHLTASHEGMVSSFVL